MMTSTQDNSQRWYQQMRSLLSPSTDDSMILERLIALNVIVQESIGICKARRVMHPRLPLPSGYDDLVVLAIQLCESIQFPTHQQHNVGTYLHGISKKYRCHLDRILTAVPPTMHSEFTHHWTELEAVITGKSIYRELDIIIEAPEALEA